MADNVAITQGSGTVIAADDIGGGVLAQRVKPVWGPDGTGNDIDVATGKPLPVQVRSATGLIPIGEPTDAKSTATDGTSASGISIWKQISASVQSLVAGVVLAAGRNALGTVTPRFINAAFTTNVRPANTTAYSVNDSISNNATAGLVTALSATVSDTNDDPVSITEILLDTNDTGLAAGVQVRALIYNSDPTASSGVGGGDNAAFSNKRAGFVGSLVGTFRAFSDGGKARLVPEEGSNIIAKPVPGAETLHVEYQALTAFTPSANSTTIDATLKGFQGRA